MGVVAVIVVVGVVYEQEVQVVRGYWSWVDASAAGAPRPAPRPQPSAPPAPSDIGAGLAAIDDILDMSLETRLIHISKARECVESVLPSLVSTAI